MLDGIYLVTIVCPVCKSKIEVSKVKIKAYKIESRDSDFFVYYSGVNPIFYDVWVCEFCGYAAQHEYFEKISVNEAARIKKQIEKKWTRRNFTVERNTDIALETFKLALITLQVKFANSSEFARICMRIAWIYRLKKDNEKEIEFLKYAEKYYEETYLKEKFPIGNLDEASCMYLVAELKRRTGNIIESMQWFSRLLSNPEAKNNKMLLDKAHDMMELVSQQMKEANKTVNKN